MNNNTVPTGFSSTTGYFKIQGTTSLIRQQKFTSTNNQVIYIDKSPTSVPVTAMIGGKSPLANSDYSILSARTARPFHCRKTPLGPCSTARDFR